MQVSKLLEETSVCLGDSVFNWSCQRGLRRAEMVQLLSLLKTVPDSTPATTGGSNTAAAAAEGKGQSKSLETDRHHDTTGILGSFS